MAFYYYSGNVSKVFLVAFDHKIEVPTKENANGAKSSKQVQQICSDVCIWGDWCSGWDICDPSAHVVGFSARIEASQGSGDDTALNALEFTCSSGPSITSCEAPWGTWQSPVRCSSGAYIYAIRLIYEPPCGNCDDTAADGIGVQCTDGNSYEGKFSFYL